MQMRETANMGVSFYVFSWNGRRRWLFMARGHTIDLTYTKSNSHTNKEKKSLSYMCLIILLSISSFFFSFFWLFSFILVIFKDIFLCGIEAFVRKSNFFYIFFWFYFQRWKIYLFYNFVENKFGRKRMRTILRRII